MSMNFNDVEGKAKSDKIEYFKFEEGDNEFRMVGGILPRYVYWNTTPKGISIAMECLEFNRDTEKFDRVEKDYFKEMFPDIKSKWAYLVQVFDKNGKLKVLSLKKKMFENIIQNSKKHWGDPTDPEKGINIIINKIKTGPKVYNIDYELDVLGCKVLALTEEQKEMLKEKPTIDALFPRQTPEEQLENINRLWFADSDKKEDAFDTSDDDDDIAF